MNYPQIRFKPGKFLDREFSDFEKVEAYRAAWEKLETRIMPAICEVLNLEYKQNIIDVYIVTKQKAFSDPLVIGTQYEVEHIVDILTHELLHRLISDNTKETHQKFGKEWDKKFPTDERLILNHILVHAVSQYVYIEVLNDPARLEWDIARCQKNPPYARAWDIVQENGYKKIIEEFVELTR